MQEDRILRPKQKQGISRQQFEYQVAERQQRVNLLIVLNVLNKYLKAHKRWPVASLKRIICVHDQQ